MEVDMRRSSAKMVVEGWKEEGDEPVRPTAQYFNSSVLCMSILVVFEFEIPINDSQTISTLENLFLPINPRFSSIMVKEVHGTPKWKRVDVELEDHINIPLFPAGLEYYDDYVQEYLSKIATDHLPQDRPLWNVHIIKYPTSSAAGTLVMKLHHSLGDGFSLMGALFNCLRIADNPSLPLTFPSRENPRRGQKWSTVYKSVSRIFSMCINTVCDIGGSLLMSSVMEDGRTPIRSGDVGIESRPITLSTVTFSLSEIKQIKVKLKGTVNDVITGIIFYDIQLYLQAAGQGTKSSRVTSLVLLNTRAITAYQSLHDMTRPNSQAPWGNHFAFLHVSVPRCTDAENADPLEFIRRAKRVIKAKRNSLAIYLTAGLLELLRKIKGPEAVARYIHTTSRNTSMAISNLIGPMEQVQIADHPVKNLYFMLAGAPQSLTTTVVSYMGKVVVAFGTEKDFINSEILVSCMKKSFERMFEAAVDKRT